jgi:hypothetical protein
MDMFKEQGVMDELGLGTIRDTLSDLLFPGTSTIQTRAKYFLIIPWILQDIESNGNIERFTSELEEAEIGFVKTLRRNSPLETGIIGATLRNSNPKRKPSSIYWNGLRTYGIVNFKGSLADYINYVKYYYKNLQKQKNLIAETDGNVGDDKDANHLYQHHLWCQIPKPQDDWNTEINIDLSLEEAMFLKERIIRSNSESLWAYTLNHVPEKATRFSDISDFLSLNNLPIELRELIKLSTDFNNLMKGALIRYNLLIQKNRENGRVNELLPIWEKYYDEITKFNWTQWDFDKLWKYCPYTHFTTKKFVEKWIEIVRGPKFVDSKADQLIKDRELRLKGIRRARLHNKAVAQKQESFTGISVFEDGHVIYLTFRWHTVRNLLIDIQKGLSRHVSA